MNIKETINKILPEDIKVKLKEHLAKFSEAAPVVEPVAPTEEKVKMANEVKLADGTSLSIDGDVAVGSPVKLVTPDGALDAMDGEYVSEDGTTYTVLNGTIAEIATKEEEAPEAPETENAMPTMMAAINDLKAELSSIKAELASYKESSKVALSAINTIIETPVVEPVEASVEFSALTPFQKYKLSKQNG